MHTGFISSAEELKTKYLFQTDDLFLANRKDYALAFKHSFLEACKKIRELQESQRIGEISYLDYTILYTNFLNRSYKAEIRIYNKEWFISKSQKAVGELDVSDLFRYFDELWDKLLAERKKYVGEVTSRDVKKCMIDVLPKFYSYLTSLCRFAILELAETEEFRSIKRAPQFEVNVGEYMSTMEPIYKEDGGKDRKELSDWFAKHLQLDYAFEKIAGIDFSGEDFSEIDFRYSDLRNANLNGVSFQDALLVGSRFCGVQAEYTDFSYSYLYEADFTNAKLSGANFYEAEARAGLPNREEWEAPGLLSVSFRNADLRNANFRNSDFYGADFTGAVMDGAVFDAHHAEKLVLTQEQRNSIILL